MRDVQDTKSQVPVTFVVAVWNAEMAEGTTSWEVSVTL